MGYERLFIIVLLVVFCGAMAFGIAYLNQDPYYEELEGIKISKELPSLFVEVNTFNGLLVYPDGRIDSLDRGQSTGIITKFLAAIAQDTLGQRFYKRGLAQVIIYENF
jgi:hypothetical protein